MRVAVSSRGADDPFLIALRPLLSESIELVVDEAGPVEILVQGTPSATDLEEREGLRAVVIPYAGVPKTTRELLANSPTLTLHNLHHNAAPTAELALALLLAAAKNIVPLDRALRARDWSPRYEPATELLLDGAHAAVLGHGAIGQRVTRGMEALGMHVTPVRRSTPTDLDALLSTVQALVIALPLTPQTEGLLDARRLALLPDGCCIVNVGRGLIIDEDAFYEELAAGRLRAGIDVWYSYPKSAEDAPDTAPSRHEFGALDNVVLSPHRGGHCMRIEELRAEHLARLLNAAANGEPIPNRVNLEAGY